jgi:predicted acyltransferase
MCAVMKALRLHRKVEEGALLGAPDLEVAPTEYPSTDAILESHAESAEPLPLKADRLVSLDAFRGLTVLLMLIVNNVALDSDVPDALTHSAWNQGLRLADYVFPWFLLCAGLAIPYSFASFAKTGLPNWRMDLRILTRSTVLFILGVLVNCAIDRKLYFSLGVLQLIGMAYLVAALAYELPPVRRVIIAVILLGSYALAIKFLPIPGSPMGSFTEDANFFGHINTTYLLIYNIDGLFSMIPTGALLIIASLVGDVLMSKRLGPFSKVGVLGIVGIAMAGLGIWSSLWIPYNKPIWTPSYILLTGGVGFLFLGAFYCITDLLKFRFWVIPLVVFGSNAILAYCLPVFLKLTVLTVWTIDTPKGKIPLQQAFVDSLVSHFGRVTGGWTYTGIFIGAWWVVLFILYRRRLLFRL